MTLNDEITKLRTTASYIGGNHLTNKEAEAKINEIADNLVKIQENLSLAIDNVKENTFTYLLGVDENYLYLIKKQRNFDELNKEGKDDGQ